MKPSELQRRSEPLVPFIRDHLVTMAEMGAIVVVDEGKAIAMFAGAFWGLVDGIDGLTVDAEKLRDAEAAAYAEGREEADRLREERDALRARVADTVESRMERDGCDSQSAFLMLRCEDLRARVEAALAILDRASPACVHHAIAALGGTGRAS